MNVINLFIDLVVAASFVLIYSFAPQYVGLYKLAIPPFHVYLFVVSIAFVLYVLGGRVAFPRGPSRLLLVWGCLLLSIMALSFILMNSTEAASEVFIRNLESVVLTLTFLLLMQTPSTVKRVTAALVLGVLLGAGLNVLEFLFPAWERFSTVVGRSAGMYSNSNLSALMLVLGMICAVFALPQRLRLPFCFVVGGGVALTFSRSGMILWAMSLLGLAAGRAFSKNRWLATGTIGAVLLLGVVTLLAGLWVKGFDAIGLSGQLTKNTTARFGGNFLEQQDLSSQERRYVAQRGLDLYLDAPVFGYGLGTSEEGETAVSVHNTYLKYGVELGSVGLGMVAWLVWILWRSGSVQGRVMAAVYGTSCLFSHNNIETPATLIMTALAVATAVPVVKEQVRAKFERPSPFAPPLRSIGDSTTWTHS